MPSLRPVLLALLVLAPLLPTAVPAPMPTVPSLLGACPDPRGCPDLSVDPAWLGPWVSHRPFPPGTCAVQEGLIESGMRRIVRFGLAARNHGPGDMVIGHPALRPEWAEYSACPSHSHWHLKGFAAYRLWTPDAYAQWNDVRNANPEWTEEDAFAAHPELKAGLVQGRKQGFCLTDVLLYEGREAPKYAYCVTQGISIGWADLYDSTVEGQWVDVTNVAAGDYVLEAEVNPYRILTETNYANNRAAVPYTLPPL